MSDAILAIVITSLVSPFVLELYRSFREKRNKSDDDIHSKIIQLETRVADLQAANTKQLVEIGVLQSRNEQQRKEIDEQAREINQLREEGKAKDVRIHDLETQVQTLNNKRGSKR